MEEKEKRSSGDLTCGVRRPPPGWQAGVELWRLLGGEGGERRDGPWSDIRMQIWSAPEEMVTRIGGREDAPGCLAAVACMA